jgi:hypothetical protein
MRTSPLIKPPLSVVVAGVALRDIVVAVWDGLNAQACISLQGAFAAIRVSFDGLCTFKRLSTSLTPGAPDTQAMYAIIDQHGAPPLPAIRIEQVH